MATELDAIRDRLTKAATEVGYEFAAHEFGQRPTTSAKLSDAQCDFEAASKAFDEWGEAALLEAVHTTAVAVHETGVINHVRGRQLVDAILKREAQRR